MWKILGVLQSVELDEEKKNLKFNSEILSG